MFSAHHKACSLLHTMLVTGIILIPAAIATPAIQDLVDLRGVINAAASAIGDPNNPNRGFGFNLFGGSGQMGTADLVNNITNTILRGKFQLDTNRTLWLLPDNLTSIPTNNTAPTQPTPTLPMTASLALPSVLPSTIPTLNNLTVDLTAPYIDYVQAIPNLSSSLTTLGRSFHREMNSPVTEAVTGLQQTLTTFQTTLLESNLITAQAVIRTIRASSSLESAATAWSRSLNLPGGGSDDDGDAGSASPLPASNRPAILGRAELQRPPPKDGRFYTHLELWNRSETRARVAMEGKARPHSGVVVQAEEKRMSTTTSAEKARVGRPFVV